MRVLFLPVVLAAGLCAAPAWAQDSPPDWLKRPNAQDIMALWPREALRSGVGGKVILLCTVSVQGALRQCAVESETPPGLGFGSAGLALTAQFVMKPALRNGNPVEGQVRIPIEFPRPDRATGSYLTPVTAAPFYNEKVVTGLTWKEAPTHAEVLAAYPEKARAEKLGGFVTLDCRITKDSRLTGCSPVREEPAGYGFGRAAKSLAPRFLAPTTISTGEPLAGVVRTHLAFAFAPESLDRPTAVIGRPRWTALPKLEDFTAVMPAAARAAGLRKARVVIGCKVGQGGVLEACGVQSEEPAGVGYGEAALALSRAFRLGVWSEEGLPTIGGSVRVPIRFDLDQIAAPPPSGNGSGQ